MDETQNFDENYAEEVGRQPSKLKSEFDKLLNQLDKEEIGYSNAKSYYEKIMMHHSLAEGHIENNENTKEQVKAKYDALRQTSSVKEMLTESKVAPIELMNNIIKAYKSLDEIHVWERLQIETFIRYTKKLYNVYMATKALEIHSAVEEGFEKRQAEWMNLVKENTQIMFTNVDNKFDNFKSLIANIENRITEQDKKLMKTELYIATLIQDKTRENKPKSKSQDYMLDDAKDEDQYNKGRKNGKKQYDDTDKGLELEDLDSEQDNEAEDIDEDGNDDDDNDEDDEDIQAKKKRLLNKYNEKKKAKKKRR